ncbi:uncharacterized protein LOC107637004 [Arachis ipaensis]|uniref:uncharacterized protein LOC107637004 n=1 Tax=Arachis ipaensis TaxID=130454 RepID=UPI0007AFBB89|nr:uncharacterized protein LOC107637004 [Arachis ipaensis]XP_025648113.1 uncharacterized protein LOC112743106 [Arachis hypogaea]
MELCVKLQDVSGSSSSSNNVEELGNFGDGEAIPFPEIGRPRSPSFNPFVVPAQNAENPHERSSLTTHVASLEGIANGSADSFDEDEIEDDSGDEAEVIPETQPLQEETFIPTQVEPINVMGVGSVSSSTLGHYLQLSLGPMHSTTAEDIPSNYALISEVELEIGLKFQNKETTMLAVKNYNIRRSAEFKVVESDHTRLRRRGLPDFGKSENTKGLTVVWHLRHCKIMLNLIQMSYSSTYSHGSSRHDHLHKSVAGFCGVSVQIQGVLQEGLVSKAKGTIFDLQTRPYYVDNTLDRDSVMFHHVLWSFLSCVEAFKHCKPLVLVDGTHLYGKYMGTLLMGIAQDGNNNILPIDFVLVEKENTDSWYFFLTNLRRHIASNFATNFKSKEAKRHIVNAAYSKTQEQAQYYLELINAEDLATSPAMMAWIRGLEPPKWLQHRDEGRRYGHMTMNLSECINSVLKEILANREGITQMLVTSYDRTTSIFIVDEIAVVGAQSWFRVFLQQRRCDCGYFQTLHYPCAHALAACTHARLDWQCYVDDVYRVENVFRVYQMEFSPLPNEEVWPPHEGQRLRPNPHMRRSIEGQPIP